MTPPPDDLVRARAAWSRLTEPGDCVAGAVVATFGPVAALEWLRRAADRSDGWSDELADLAPDDRRRVHAAVRRWRPRLEVLDTARDLAMLARLDGVVIVPEDPRWPPGLADLGHAAPHCLWVRGRPELRSLLARSVAVVGSRACTGYGEHVTAQIAGGLADRGWTVVSGGAYGIDAIAHRAAVAGQAPTVAVLAGGVDRLYPAGNARLLASVAEVGAIVSEVPPGCAPVKSRFLQRNRVIAAAGRATVVVEAAWRSGALSTAGHAAGLLRPVGAVPGPVTSAASAGCHRLLRSGAATCVTDAAEVLDLAGGIGQDLADEPDEPTRPGDGLDPNLRRILDALPVSRHTDIAALARVAGLGADETVAGLARLELTGLVRRSGARWARGTQ